MDKVKVIEKSWGYEKIIENNDLYCGKILFIKKNHCISLQFHKLKDETFFIFKGELLAKFSTQDSFINPEEIPAVKMVEGDVRRVRIGEIHQLFALEDSLVFEVSSTHHDDDTYRISKEFVLSKIF